LVSGLIERVCLKYPMKILRFATLVISLSIIVAFFMPWVKGEGSIVKSVDDATKRLQEIDQTGLTKSAAQATKDIVDKATETFTPIRLKQTLSGFQIPLVENKSLKEKDAKVYVVYIAPLLAFLCALLSLPGKQRVWCIAAQFFIALSMFLILDLSVALLHVEGLFVKIQACCGLIYTQYAFLAVVVTGFLEMTVSAKAK